MGAACFRDLLVRKQRDLRAGHPETRPSSAAFLRPTGVGGVRPFRIVRKTPRVRIGVAANRNAAAHLGFLPRNVKSRPSGRAQNPPWIALPKPQCGVHAGAMDIDVSLVRRLVAAQFPQWAELPVRPIEFGGWDNRTFHLGDRMTARLPSAAAYALQVEKEHRWLPKLAPLLPLAIPAPLAMGVPTDFYPWRWSVYRWIDGETAATAQIADLCQFAATLADFLVALLKVDADGGPEPGRHNFFRGGSLTVYDGETRQALKTLDGQIDTGMAAEVWEAALASSWPGPPVWVHGDVSSGNLLVEEGRLSAVIDFGSSAVGDPACDLYIAWTFFDEKSRDTFRAALPLDGATWARGRGWTLWKAMITLAEHMDANPDKAGIARRVINEVLADHRRTT
jgi:aminoglycoside phosphotransferase (APT) family kinase protein